MPGWVLDMIGVFLGAVLGALFGYAATHWKSRQEERARRDALIRALHLQMGTITWTPVSLTPESNSLLVWTPHRVPAIDHLLNSHVLDATKDADLIRALSLFQGSLEAYNDALETMHLTIIMPGTSPNLRAKSVERLEGRRDNMTHMMRFVQELLPEEEEIEYRQPLPWPYVDNDDTSSV